jgi:hypothetical protein
LNLLRVFDFALGLALYTIRFGCHARSSSPLGRPGPHKRAVIAEARYGGQAGIPWRSAPGQADSCA